MRPLDVLIVAGFDYPHDAGTGYSFRKARALGYDYVEVITRGIMIDPRKVALAAVQAAGGDTVQRIGMVANPSHLDILSMADYRRLDVLIAAGCPVNWPASVVDFAIKAGKAGMHAESAMAAWKAPAVYVFERMGDTCAQSLTKHVAEYVQHGAKFGLAPSAFILPAKFSQPVITGFPIGNFNTYVVAGGDFNASVREAIVNLIVKRWIAVELSQSPYNLAGFQLPDGMPGGNVLNYMGVPWWLWGIGGAAAVAGAWWLADKAGK